MTKRKVINIALIILGIIILAMLNYSWKYSMRISDTYQINDPNSTKSILIATQKSSYKDEVTKLIINELEDMDVYVKVIDVTQINCDYHNGFDAYIILHTWEMYKVPKDLREFLADCEVEEDSFLIGTSGNGGLQVEGVDGITSASLIINAEKDAEKALNWLSSHLDSDLVENI